jgi:hypothetical protein
MRTSYRMSLFLAFLLLLVVMIFGCSFESSQLVREQTVVPPSPTMGARTISPRFSESITWRKSNIYIRLVPVLPPVLLAGHGYVAFIAFNGGPLSLVNQLQVLDANSGIPLWQSERFPDYEAMALSRDKAFVLLDLGRTLNIYNTMLCW